MPVLLRGDLLTLPQRARETAHAAVRAALRPPLQRLVNSAKARWPVKTGTSKALLDVEDVTNKGAVAITDRAPYTTKIVSKGRRPWFDLVVVPVQYLSRDTLPKAIGRALIKALKGSRRGR